MHAFWIFMLVMVMLIPLTMIGWGDYFSKNAPKKINRTLGYRTTRSMKNKDTWEFAHHYFGMLWRKTGLIIAPITLASMLFSFGKDMDYVANYSMIVVGVQMIVMFISIFMVESELKRVFEKDGQRKQ